MIEMLENERERFINSESTENEKIDLSKVNCTKSQNPLFVYQNRILEKSCSFENIKEEESEKKNWSLYNLCKKRKD